MKSRLILLTAIFINTCSSPNIRLENPISGEAKIKTGIVGFGILVKVNWERWDMSNKDWYSYVSTDPQAEFHMLDPTLDIKDYIYQSKLFKTNSPVKIENEEVYSSNFSDTINMENPGQYMAFQLSDENLKLALRRFITHNNGFRFNIALPPPDSHQVMPIKIKIGELTFLGNFLVTVSVKSEQFKANEIKIGIEPATQFLLNSTNSELKTNFFGNEEHTAKGMEIHFLKNFAKLQSSGHWKNIALQRVKKIKSLP